MSIENYAHLIVPIRVSVSATWLKPTLVKLIGNKQMVEETTCGIVHIIQVQDHKTENAEEIQRQAEESKKILAHVQNMGKDELIDQITYARRFCINIFNDVTFALEVTTNTDEEGFNSKNLEEKTLRDMWLNMWSFSKKFQKETADLADKFSNCTN